MSDNKQVLSGLVVNYSDQGILKMKITAPTLFTGYLLLELDNKKNIAIILNLVKMEQKIELHFK